MPAAKQGKSGEAKHDTAKENEAIAQLTEDHARVKNLFKEYERLVQSEAQPAERQELAMMICAELTAHSTAEEEIFYPAVREGIDEEDLVDEALVEHGTAKDLIVQLQATSPDEDSLYDAKVKVLGEYINHHVREEESEMFPLVRRAKLDTVMLGEQIAARKAEVMRELGVEMAE